MRKLDEELLKHNIEKRAHEALERKEIGGAAIAVMQEGKTVYQAYFSSKPLGIHVDENTIFRMASMTKPIVAIAVLILVDRGMLRLDDPIALYIPEFTEMNVGSIHEGTIRIVGKAKTTITIRHLLTHSSGLISGPVGEFVFGDFPKEECKSLRQMATFYAGQPLDFEPGSAQAYSGIAAFDTLARIVEIVSGSSIDVFLQKEIFEPLAMVNTTFEPSEEQWRRLILMHSCESGEGKVVDFYPNSLFAGTPVSYHCGGAGLASTLEDYKKFASMLLDYGRTDQGQLVAESLIREMSRPQLPTDYVSNGDIWGLGVRVVVDTSYTKLPLNAWGWSGAYGTHFWIDPENCIAAVYMRNATDANGAGALTARQFEEDVYASLK